MAEWPAIEFPEHVERYDVDRDIALFPARTADGDIACAISGEALLDHFEARGASRRALIAAFRAHRSEIEDLAERKFSARSLEPDGSILITKADV